MSDGFDDVRHWIWGKRGHYERIIEYPEAVIRLIDALRLYLDVSDRDEEDFRDEIEITKEQLLKWQAERGVMEAVLRKLEQAEISVELDQVLRKAKR